MSFQFVFFFDRGCCIICFLYPLVYRNLECAWIATIITTNDSGMLGVSLDVPPPPSSDPELQNVSKETQKSLYRFLPLLKPQHNSAHRVGGTVSCSCSWPSFLHAQSEGNPVLYINITTWSYFSSPSQPVLTEAWQFGLISDEDGNVETLSLTEAEAWMVTKLYTNTSNHSHQVYCFSDRICACIGIS